MIIASRLQPSNRRCNSRVVGTGSNCCPWHSPEVKLVAHCSITTRILRRSGNSLTWCSHCLRLHSLCRLTSVCLCDSNLAFSWTWILQGYTFLGSGKQAPLIPLSACTCLPPRRAKIAKFRLAATGHMIAAHLQLYHLGTSWAACPASILAECYNLL